MLATGTLGGYLYRLASSDWRAENLPVCPTCGSLTDNNGEGRNQP